MTHAWCRDPSRDERVRAAEDGRTAPLPTLEECIETAFSAGVRDSFRKVEEAWAMIPKSVSASSPVDQENKGDGMGDEIRKQRITLEIECDAIIHSSQWPWTKILRDGGVIGSGESVRVVRDEEREEFPSSCPIAGGTVVVNGEDMVTLSEFLRHTTKLTQEAGVAKRERDELRKSWLRSEESGTRLLAERNAALDAADGLRKRVAELEAASGGGEQPRGWLTESERELIGKLRKNVAAIHLLHVERDANGFAEAVQQSVKTVDSLLARSSPPKVVLPGLFALSLLGDRLLVEAQVKDALAAAGVEVKLPPGPEGE